MPEGLCAKSGRFLSMKTKSCEQKLKERTAQKLRLALELEAMRATNQSLMRKIEAIKVILCIGDEEAGTTYMIASIRDVLEMD